MRRGFNTLAAQAEHGAGAEDPYSGHLFVFRGGVGDLLKIIWWDGKVHACSAKRLERGRFVWPAAKDGKVSISASQLDDAAGRASTGGCRKRPGVRCALDRSIKSVL